MANTPSPEAAAGLIADLLGSGILFTRHHLREYGVRGLRNGGDPEQVLEEVMQIIENRILWNSREHARIVALLLHLDHAGFQSAVHAHLQAQMSRVQEQGFGVGWAQGSVDVGVSLEAQNIVDVLAGWQPQTSSEISDEEYTWMETLPNLLNDWDVTDDHQTYMNTSLPDFPDGSYNGVVFGPLFPGDDYHVAPEEEQFFQIADVSIALDEAAGVANAPPVGETAWGESLRGGLGGH